jgi:hypothetical protein
MYYKIFFILSLFILSNCTLDTTINNKINKTFYKEPFINKGFALIYNDDLFQNKIINKKLDNKSFILLQTNLIDGTTVKIKNLLNDKYTIAKVTVDSNYPSFNNSVITTRIADEIELDLDHPYIEITEIIDGSHFVAKKTQTFDEEKNVAAKAPIDDINISDLSNTDNDSTKIKKDKKINKSNFVYIIKIADFYFIDTAKTMIDRIKNESSVKNIKLKKMSDTKFRVYLGSFSDLKSLQIAFNDINVMNFENIEIIKND